MKERLERRKRLKEKQFKKEIQQETKDAEAAIDAEFKEREKDLDDQLNRNA